MMASPPNEESLRELLARVHQRLRGAGSLDAESRGLLVELTRDIEQALGGGARESAHAVPRLESLAVRFEAEHPQLAQALRQLMDALVKAGI
jgi:hypothetical protein